MRLLLDVRPRDVVPRVDAVMKPLKNCSCAISEPALGRFLDVWPLAAAYFDRSMSGAYAPGPSSLHYSPVSVQVCGRRL